MITNTPVLALATWSIVLIVILVVLVAALIGLYFFGRNAEKKQAEQQKTMEANAQTINAFVIDKKKLKLKEAGLPSIVLEQSPKYARISKVPIVKVKAGPRVMNLIADPKVYEQILPKQDIKVFTLLHLRESVVRFMNHLRKRRDLAESNICVKLESTSFDVLSIYFNNSTKE